MFQKLINHYPLYFPKFYVWLRQIVLPLSEIEKYVPKNGTILDVGRGFGLVSIFLFLKSTKRNILGTDINSYRINIASKASRNYPSIEFKTMPLIPCGRRFDCILAVDLFHHPTLEAKHQFASTARHALSKNGTLVLKEIDAKMSYKYYINYIHDKITTRFQSLEYRSAPVLQTFFTNHGFSLVSTSIIIHPLYPHRIYVFK